MGVAQHVAKPVLCMSVEGFFNKNGRIMVIILIVSICSVSYFIFIG
jgi:hypothetical protein